MKGGACSLVFGGARHFQALFRKTPRFGSDVELMIVYGAAIAHYGFGTPVRALPISRYLEMPRETVRRHMGRLVALGLFEREKDQTFVPSKELRERDYCDYRRLFNARSRNQSSAERAAMAE